jgi:hypothetical protein
MNRVSWNLPSDSECRTGTLTAPAMRVGAECEEGRTGYRRKLVTEIPASWWQLARVSGTGILCGFAGGVVVVAEFFAAHADAARRRPSWCSLPLWEKSVQSIQKKRPESV